MLHVEVIFSFRNLTKGGAYWYISESVDTLILTATTNQPGKYLAFVVGFKR